jgi:hypothetical protein
MGAKPLRILLLAAGVLAPLMLLFDPTAAFYGDWDVNLWLVGYQGEFFRDHGHFPAVLSLNSAVGLPVPVFYGYLLYPLLGFLASGVGAALALRLGCVLLLTLEGYALLCAGRSVLRDRRMAWAVAACVLWSVYSLTNLYNRSAVAEYFGGGFFVAAMAFAIAAASEFSRARRRRYVWLAGLCAVLTLGSHPPTALLAAPCLAALALLVAVGCLRRAQPISRAVALTLGAPLALGALILAPWLYASIRWNRKLGIIGHYGGLSFYGERSDSLLGRLSPLPYDGLSVRQGTAGVATPYLEAPLIAGLGVLLLLNLILLYRLRGGTRRALPTAWDGAAAAALVAAVVGCGLFTVLSLCPPLAAQFRFLGPYVQFAYRLVSFSNGALLVAVLASGALVARQDGFVRFARLTAIGGLVALGLAAVGLGIKLDHAALVEWQCRAPEYSVAGPKAGLVTGDFGRFAGNYATPLRYRELKPAEAAAALRLDLPVDGRCASFGAVAAKSLTAPVAAWALTNIVAFPWNDLWLNGRRIPARELARQGNFFAVRLPAGPATLRWAWRPDPYWAALHRGGGIAAFLLALATLGLGLVGGLKRLRTSPRVSP